MQCAQQSKSAYCRCFQHLQKNGNLARGVTFNKSRGTQARQYSIFYDIHLIFYYTSIITNIVSKDVSTTTSTNAHSFYHGIKNETNNNKPNISTPKSKLGEICSISQACHQVKYKGSLMCSIQSLQPCIRFNTFRPLQRCFKSDLQESSNEKEKKSLKKVYKHFFF